jgi:hypothetical protein
MNAVTSPTKLTVQDILAGYDNDEWLGFGYLGERSNALDGSDPESPARPERVALVDQFIVDQANARGWTADRLFTWLNSKDARHFADQALSSEGPVADRWSLVR